MVCILGAWWGRLVLSQARKIAELEGALGLAADLTQNHWHRTQRMLYWESLTFFALVLGATSLLFWLYWRDLKRARGLHAFFASVTHELRTPLTSIRLQAESIAETLSAEGSEKNLVQRLLEDTIRLEAQVERTLELARVEGGGPVYIQPLQIKPWLDRFLKLWSADYLGKVELQSSIDDVVIQADPTALQVIFKNLLENSIRHSKKQKVFIQIRSKFQDQGVLLQILDNGPGYSGNVKTLGQLFQKGPVSQGTGVGLYLVRVLMERMNGKVYFDFPSGFQVGLWFPGETTHG
jgi:signal transduction histidine kinase